MGRPKKIEQSAEMSILDTPHDTENVNVGSRLRGVVIPLISNEDVVLHKGKVLVPTAEYVKDNMVAMVVSTQDNAVNGLLVEDGKRLETASVVSMSVEAHTEIYVVININEDVSIVRQTQYGTRMDSLVLPSGTHVADLVIFK